MVRLFWFFSEEAAAVARLIVVTLVTKESFLTWPWLDLSVFSGELRHRATKTERTAGLIHSLSGKLIPGKMHTPTCWPKMRKATYTKFSVSPARLSQFIIWSTKHLTLFKQNVSFQFIMSSQSAWTRTTNFGECCWCHSRLPSLWNGGCGSLRPRRPFTH